MMWADVVAAPQLYELPVIQLILKVLGVLVLFVVLVLIPVMGVLSRRQVASGIAQPGLYGIVGQFGSGKSLFMSYLVVNGSHDGRQILSNCGMKGAASYESWLDLMWKADDGALILMDEVSLWCPAGNAAMPALLDAWIRQLRKRRITMVWASQGWGHVGKKLRDLTFACWVAKKIDGHHVMKLHERSQMDRRNHGEFTTKLHVRRSKAVKEAYNTFELVEPGGWEDVPNDVSIADFLRASGREQIHGGTRWSPRPADGPELDAWLLAIPPADEAPARRATKERTGRTPSARTA